MNKYCILQTLNNVAGHDRKRTTGRWWLRWSPIEPNRWSIRKRPGSWWNSCRVKQHCRRWLRPRRGRGWSPKFNLDEETHLWWWLRWCQSWWRVSIDSQLRAVKVVPIQWPEARQRQPKVASALGWKLKNTREKARADLAMWCNLNTWQLVGLVESTIYVWMEIFGRDRQISKFTRNLTKTMDGIETKKLNEPLNHRLDRTKIWKSNKVGPTRAI